MSRKEAEMRNHMIRKRPLGHAEMTWFDVIMFVAVCSTALVIVCSCNVARTAGLIPSQKLVLTNNSRSVAYIRQTDRGSGKKIFIHSPS
jgi:hypothetical protein